MTKKQAVAVSLVAALGVIGITSSCGPTPEDLAKRVTAVEQEQWQIPEMGIHSYMKQYHGGSTDFVKDGTSAYYVCNDGARMMFHHNHQSSTLFPLSYYTDAGKPQ